MTTAPTPPRYESPLSSRYAGPEIQKLFSPQHRAYTWRLLWYHLAKEQQALGLDITDEQLSQMHNHLNTANLERVHEHERITRHDVMAHIHTYGEDCPKAKGIIHLGATSCYVTDNGDLLILREALHIIEKKLLLLLNQLSISAKEYSSLPCLAFTHLQPAQPTTVGKRICLWLQDFLFDLRDLQQRINNLRLLGVKGATGSQASFLSLFNGDIEKVNILDNTVCKALGFPDPLIISGQTYSRKIDVQLLDPLSGLATSAHKMATDLRLLAHQGEFAEPWNETKKGGQVGSSAMPYKRNPMLSERCCSLARYLISVSDNTRYTAALQWFERSLDDSANRRIALPEAFLSADAVLNILITLTAGWQWYPKVIAKNLDEQLPFLATEEILMRAVKAGADRQQIHERLRQHAQNTANNLREGNENTLLGQIANDSEIPLNSTDLDSILDANLFIGLCPQQVERFLNEEVFPVLEGQQPLSLDTRVEV